MPSPPELRARTGARPGAIAAGLMLMSLSSGCTDVLSYRFLHGVFTSAMTGNVALMGLELGRGDLLSAARNVTAFATFLLGLLAGAALLRRPGRPGLLRALALEAALLAAFALLWALRGPDLLTYVLIGLSAVAMGLQSAVAHRIGVPGITTTYFTGTLTSIVFGLFGGGAPGGRPGGWRWPVLAFAAYVAGAAGAGWYTAGRNAPEAAQGLPALPAAAVLALLLIILLSPPRPPADGGAGTPARS